MECPLCGKSFQPEKIEEHVNACLDGGGPPSPVLERHGPPPRVDPPPVITRPGKPVDTYEIMQIEQNHKKVLMDEDTDTDKPEDQTKPMETLTEEEELAKQQLEAYLFWERKKKQEEEDMRMAMELEKEVAKEPPKPTTPTTTTPTKPPTTPTTPTTPTPTPTPKKPSLSDSELAKKLYEEEQQAIREAARAKAEADRLLAEELWRKEREEEEERKKKKEWEETLKLIQAQAKAESDREIAKALREKERLAAELERLRQEEAEKGEKHVAVVVDQVEYPDTWEYQRSDVQTFEVKKGTEEWNEVYNSFMATCGGHFTVKRIERNQNKPLWTFYFLRREQVATKNDKNANEKMLYHGSRSNAYTSILSDGFDHRVADMGGAIGAGVYFATHASTSTGYVASGKWGDKKMLYCRVTLGSVGVGQTGLRRPPDKRGGGIHDSVGQVHGGNGMYVVFDNAQAYPEYTIYYK